MSESERNMTEDERLEHEQWIAHLLSNAPSGSVEESKRRHARIAYHTRPPTAVEQVVIEAPEPPEWPEIIRLREDEPLGAFRGMAWASPVAVLVWVLLYQLWR